MKRKWIFISIAAIVGVIGIIGIASAIKKDPLLSKAEVRNLVKEQYSGSITGIHLDQSEGKDNYKVGLEEKTGLYELEVDAITGNIKNLVQVKKLESEQTNEPAISEEKAKQLAVDKYSGNVRSLSAGEEQGEKIYHITIRTKQEEIKLVMSANSGEITSEDKRSIEKDTQQVKLTEVQARKIALDEINGKIEDIELEEDDGHVFYEVEMDAKEQEAVIQIDAFTGEILSVVIENEDE